MLQHAVGIHSWTGNVKHHKCSHPDKGEDDEVEHLDKESAAFAALRKVISAPALLQALSQMTEFCHTGELEVFHSYLLKYWGARGVPQLPTEVLGSSRCSTVTY